MKITIMGNNSYSVQRRLKELSESFIKRHGDLALQRIDAEEADTASIAEAVASPPFLAQRKMIIIRNLSRLRPEAGMVEQIISSADSQTDLIFHEPEPDRRAAVYKVLKSSTELEEYDELEAPDLAKWLVSEAGRLGAKVSLADAKYLVDKAGANQALLDGEIEKLALYETSITKDIIDLLSVRAPQGRVFDLLDCAFSGDRRKALTLYEQQRAQKVEPQAILAMIVWQLQLITLAMTAGRRSSAQIAKDAKTSPYPVTKSQRLAAGIGSRRLLNLISEALDIDRRSKTSTLDLDEALKNYILAI